MHTIKSWLTLAIAITCFSAVLYAEVQQNYRTSANDPQIQLAEDVTNAWENGASPSDLVSPNKIDIAQSLAPFVTIFDDNKQVIASSGQLDGASLTPPSGVFDSVKARGEERLTWQPLSSIREATVMLRVDGTNTKGYVLAARSLREIEKREHDLGVRALVGWLITLFATLIASHILSGHTKRTRD